MRFYWNNQDNLYTVNELIHEQADLITLLIPKEHRIFEFDNARVQHLLEEIFLFKQEITNISQSNLSNSISSSRDEIALFIAERLVDDYIVSIHESKDNELLFLFINYYAVTNQGKVGYSAKQLDLLHDLYFFKSVEIKLLSLLADLLSEILLTETKSQEIEEQKAYFLTWFLNLKEIWVLTYLEFSLIEILPETNILSNPIELSLDSEESVALQRLKRLLMKVEGLVYKLHWFWMKSKEAGALDSRSRALSEVLNMIFKCSTTENYEKIQKMTNLF